MSAASPSPNKAPGRSGLPGDYGSDDAALSRYVQSAKTEEGFRRFVDEWLGAAMETAMSRKQGPREAGDATDRDCRGTPTKTVYDLPPPGTEAAA